jgi:hypothetical protein
MLRSRIITCLLGIWLLWLGGAAPIAFAEDVAIKYQVLNTVQGFNNATWTLTLELRNLSGEELNNLSVALLTSPPFLYMQGIVVVGTLSAAEPRIVTAEFTITDKSMTLNEKPLSFFLQYQTADGIPRSATLQGQPVKHIGEAAP